MNKTKFLQTDKRWGSLDYPKAPWYIRNCGCGEVSIANVIIEIEKYKNYTPATIQPYCKQYAAPNGNGTYFAGIPKMMAHYGLTEVKEHDTMGQLWKELEKGDRVAIYLMGSRPGGSKRVHWTSGGHFVCSVGYKVKDKKHYVYVKDSYSNSKLRNGWISYEENMRNDVVRVWSGKLPKKKAAPKKTTAQIAQEVINGKWGNGDERVKKIKAAGYDPVEVQKKVNELLKPKEPTLLDKEIEACKKQAEWMQNYHYAWEPEPTIPKSKKRGTCVTYIACVLQRLGYLKSGEFIWHNEKGKVTHATKQMKVIYPKKQTLKSYKAKLKAGDIVLTGKPNDVGSGSHILMFAGKWKDGNPYVYDNHSAERVRNGKSAVHTYNGDKHIIAVVRLKKK